MPESLRFTPESLKEGFSRLEKEPFKITYAFCGRCGCDLGTNEGCDICKGIMDWAKDEAKKQN